MGIRHMWSRNNRACTGDTEKTQEPLRVLTDTAEIICSSVDEQIMLSRSTDKLRRGVDAEVGAVRRSENDYLRLVVISQTGEVEAPQKAIIPLKDGNGIAVWVFQTGKTVLLNGNVQQYPRFAENDRPFGGCSIRSMLTVPLRSMRSMPKRTLGVAQVFNSMHGGFSELDIQLLLVWSSMVSMALEKYDQMDEGGSSYVL